MQPLIRVATRLSFLLLMALPFAAAPPALAAPDSPHLAQHRELTGKFTTQLQTDPAAAMKFAKAAVEAAKSSG